MTHFHFHFHFHFYFHFHFNMRLSMPVELTKSDVSNAPNLDGYFCAVTKSSGAR